MRQPAKGGGRGTQSRFDVALSLFDISYEFTSLELKSNVANCKKPKHGVAFRVRVVAEQEASTNA